jgi:chromate reductase
MKKILAFAGSNSSTSINHALISFAVSKVANAEIKLIKLVDYPLPLFSEDIERELGYSVNLKLLKNEFLEADAIMMSVNEHNGTVSAFFKNVLDWLSRVEYKFLEGKKILLMSTSNGKRGAASSLAYTKGVLPRFGGDVIESFSFPSFSENFSKEDNIITNEALLIGFTDVLENFIHQLEL